MPTFAASDKRTITIAASLERVAAALGQPELVKVNLGDPVDSTTTLDEHTLRIVRKPVEELGVRFRGDYTVRYTYDGAGRVTWSTISDGNMRARGEARLEAAGGITRVVYEEAIECDMEVNRILGAMLRPIVERKIKSGIGEYLERVKASLER